MSDLKVVVRNNGPLRIEGELVLLNQTASLRPGGRTAISLCRCGQSANKPFCDGATGAGWLRFRLRGPRASSPRAQA